MIKEKIIIQDLFRKEFARMIAVISNLFGLAQIELAEDIVSDTFLQASESWTQNGIPPNPEAWLYAVAKQKTLYQFRRTKILNEKVLPKLKGNQTGNKEMPDIDFTLSGISDSQLKMMFAVCNPAVSSESQIGLALRILCGFGVEEIAESFFTSKETINKRLFRAKEKLRSENIKLDFPAENEIPARLENVLRIIYLLFNEGYHSATDNHVLKKDFCLEAIRLGIMLAEFEKTNLPKTSALVALMCFHASRFEARTGQDDMIILYDDQDESLWSRELIAKGNHFLMLSANGNELSAYHIEAGIAFWHCQKEDTPDKWKNILNHYNLLQKINYSTLVELNRIYALYKSEGAQTAIQEAEKLRLVTSHYYYTLLGQLYTGIDIKKARENFEKALVAAKNDKDKETIRAKIHKLSV
jgi:predicted RNA polymerase sigma factor